jgi:hypothetical protein
MWRRDGDRFGLALVDECEAFLDGRFVEYLVEHDAPVPVWAWTNLLAHGTEDQLRAASNTASGLAALEPWLLARHYLAGEVLQLASSHGPLDRVQARLLIPLERDLASRAGAARWRPSEWVSAVLATLAPLTAWHPSRARSSFDRD